MRKYILSILACILIASCSFAQGTRIQPGGVPTPVPVYSTTAISNLTYNIASNLVQQLGSTLLTNNITVSNINTIVNSNINVLATNTFSAVDEYSLSRYFSNIVFEKYTLDFGVTNSIGQPVNYAHLYSTNFPPGLIFDNLANLGPNRQLSFNVTASANKTLFFPTNTFWPPRFDTNGWSLSSSVYWAKVLTNGNEFRMTIKTNDAGLSTTWHIYTQ